MPWSGPVARAQLPGLVGAARVLGGWRSIGCVNEFGYTGKPQHTLQDLAEMGVLRLVQGSGRD